MNDNTAAFRPQVPDPSEILKMAGGPVDLPGYGSRLDVHRGTYRMVGDQGENEWRPDEESGPHLRVTEKVDKNEVARLIDALMCRGPKVAPVNSRFQDPHGLTTADALKRCTPPLARLSASF